jgi:hypothetical protein
MATYDSYCAVALTGAKSLQSIAVGGLAQGDAGMVFVPATFRSYLYTLDDDSGSGANSPLAITPSGGVAERWILTYVLEPAKYLVEVAGDPPEPGEGECVIWMTNGTGSMGDDGDVIVASNPAGTTRYTIINNHSAGGLWGT